MLLKRLFSSIAKFKLTHCRAILSGISYDYFFHKKLITWHLPPSAQTGHYSTWQLKPFVWMFCFLNDKIEWLSLTIQTFTWIMDMLSSLILYYLVCVWWWWWWINWLVIFHLFGKYFYHKTWHKHYF